ncbi:hypothetical protein COCNU_scaffold002458G000010 [Cocos nucifera]|nr:hypothetical protein [Cocos nucifera]
MFLEQSNVASATYPVDLLNDLLPAISAAYFASFTGHLPSRSRCCPTLIAWFYASYFTTTLEVYPLLTPPTLDLPFLLDDSKVYVSSIEHALYDHDIRLPHINGGSIYGVQHEGAMGPTKGDVGLVRHEGEGAAGRQGGGGAMAHGAKGDEEP